MTFLFEKMKVGHQLVVISRESYHDVSYPKLSLFFDPTVLCVCPSLFVMPESETQNFRSNMGGKEVLLASNVIVVQH